MAEHGCLQQLVRPENNDSGPMSMREYGGPKPSRMSKLIDTVEDILVPVAAFEYGEETYGPVRN